MSRTRTLRRVVGALAVVGLAAGTLTALGATAQAAPGEASITVSKTTNLGTVELVTVSGNAGPLSTDNNGSDPGGVPDANYPPLYVSMCMPPLTSTSCDTELSNGTTASSDTNPSTAPRVVRVVPAANGDWGPVTFLVRKTLINGDGVKQCGTGANACIIGAANAPRPKDHSYDAVSPTLTWTAPAINIDTPGPHSNGQTVAVSGTNFPMNTVFDSGLGSNVPATKGIALFQCKLPVTGASDCNTSDLTTGVVVSTSGSFTANMVVSDTVEGFNCGVVTCGVGSINGNPGPPDMWSVYGPGTFAFPMPPNVQATALNNRGTPYAAAPQTGSATATRIGKSISLDGKGYTPSTAFDSLELCDVDGLNCSASYLKGNTTLTNPVTLGSASATGTKLWQTYVDTTAPLGVHTVKVVQGAITTVTPPFTILGTPTIAAPATAVLGHSITVSGSNWDPGTTLGEGSASANPTVTVTAGSASTTVVPDANGAFTVSLTVNDPAATQITATSGASGWLLNAAPSAFSYVLLADSCIVPDGGSCQLFEDVNLQVTGGDLFMDKDPGTVVMDEITLDGTDQSSTGDVRQVTVTDARGSSAGWTLNASLSDLTTGGGTNPNSTIAASGFAWAPACVTTNGGAVVTAGTASHLSNSDQVFCSTASGQGGGIFTADSTLTVPVPATQAAGLYTGILTLTLS